MVSVVIPAYNEEENIAKIIEEIPDGFEKVVVNDGSTDRTAGNATKADKIISHNVRRGKGAAYKTGLKFASYNEIVFIDGDGQFDPSEINKLIRNLKNSDFVVGRRVGNIPFHRKITNKLSKSGATIASGKPILDALSGFKATRKDVLNSLNLELDDYRSDVEQIIKAARNKYKISFLPVKVNYADEKTYITAKDNFKIALFIFMEAWKGLLGRL